MFFIFSGRTVLAWVEYPSNPVYDPVVTAEKAYFPSVLKIGTGDYRMWYQSNSTPSNATIAYATSADGIAWIISTSSVSGLIPNNAGHPHVEFADGKYRIWYWNAVSPYTNAAMHYAESLDGVTWTNDSAITGNLITSASGQWNSGSYGVVDVIVNNAPTNIGTNPFDYKYAMYYDATSGGYEQIALGYSIDGIAWTLYGTGPVLSKGGVGSWDSGYVTAGTVIKEDFWKMWYSGGISASNEGIGCATSLDGLVWTKCSGNPFMSKNDGVAWRNNRTYTPSIINDSGVYKMYFTGRDTATGNYAIGYSTLTATTDNLYLSAIISGAVGLPAGTSNVILGNNSVLNVASSTNVASGGTVVIAGVTTTLSNFTSGNLTGVNLSTPQIIGGQSVSVGKAVQISSGSSGVPIALTNSALSTANVSLPDNTTILAPSAWDGTIAPPKTRTSVGDTAPSGYSIGTAIEVGSPDVVLLLDKAVLITLSDITGSVGYKSSGSTTWSQITTTCGGSYTTPTLSSASFPGECSISNGTDTKILTYHLTAFGGLTPTTATLHVVKLVVNGSGGTGPGTLIPSNFTVHVKNVSGTDVSGSPQVGTSTPGTSYTLSPGTYTISEDTNVSYVESFLAGDCAGGSITLSVGDDKICTIVNTDIPSPALVPPQITQGGGGGGGSINPGVNSAQPAEGYVNYGTITPVVPAIGILKVPNPLALSGGSGLVTYDYTVWNIGGLVPVADIKVTDDKCSPVTLLSGDTNSNRLLDKEENWKYRCTATLLRTTTNTSVATGHSGDQAAIATAINTVVVTPGFPDTSILPPLINIVAVPSRLTPLPSDGGNITYAYVVTNPGLVAMHDVRVTDDKCSPVTRNFNDANLNGNNNNNLLDPGESWTYTCSTRISVSTRNVSTAIGRANGLFASGYGFATVLVSAPGFPNAGPTPAFGEEIRKIAVNLFEGGRRNNNVAILQQFLIAQNKGPHAQALAVVGATAYFGKMTRSALAEFQASVGISPALGNFGPITRDYLNKNY